MIDLEHKCNTKRVTNTSDYCILFPSLYHIPKPKNKNRFHKKTTGEPLKLSCYPFYSLKQICHTVHNITHMVKRGVTIQIHGNLYLTMAQNIAEGFHIYSTFNGTGGKCIHCFSVLRYKVDR